MLVRIIRSEIIEGEPFVQFGCAAGTGAGRWRGALPRAGEEFDVELDVALAGASAAAVPGAEPSIALRDGEVELIVAVESVDEDGVAAARVAPDCVVLLDAGAFSLPPGTSARLVLPVDAVSLWPYAL